MEYVSRGIDSSGTQFRISSSENQRRRGEENSSLRSFDPSFFHGDATSSMKENSLRRSQCTAHVSTRKTTKRIGKDTCIRVEPDIDYYKDLGAHAHIGGPSRNHITNSLTESDTGVRCLRWIAGKQFGLPEF